MGICRECQQALYNPTEETIWGHSQYMTVHRLCVWGTQRVSVVLTASPQSPCPWNLSFPRMSCPTRPPALHSWITILAQLWLNKPWFLRSILISANTIPPSWRPVHTSCCLEPAPLLSRWDKLWTVVTLAPNKDAWWKDNTVRIHTAWQPRNFQPSKLYESYTWIL